MERKRKLNRLKRLCAMFLINIVSGGYKKAEVIRKMGLFGEFGKDNYWFPRKLPAEPKRIRIHNNVNIATEVYFCDHDVIHHMLNNVPEYVSGLEKRFPYATYDIEVFDNVFIGARAIVMGNVKIGPNAIVAAGAVVTKSVPPNSVVAGNPAVVISDISSYVEKRKKSII